MYSILLLGPSLSAVSGVSTHLDQIIGSLLAQEFRLVHFQIGSEGRKESFIDKFTRFAASPLTLAWKLVTLRPAAVHLNTSMDSKAFWRDAVYLIVAKLLGRKVIYQVHGGDLPDVFFGTRGLRNRFARWLLYLPDAVILLAEVERHAYKSFSRFKRLSVIPNAIDIRLYAESAQIKSFDSEQPLQLGYIGRLAADKGIFEAVESLDVLRRRGFDRLQFTIAGSGPVETKLRERVHALNLDGTVRFVGPVFGEAKIRFWRETDIFVFPTYHREGLPYTVLESLASGTPMVTTRMGGIPDAVNDGVHGFLVEPGDPATVADAIQAMASDRPRLRRMSLACVQRAQEQYSVERLADQMSALYRNILG